MSTNMRLREEGDERGLDRQRLGPPSAAQHERAEERAQEQQPDRPELDERQDQLGCAHRVRPGAQVATSEARTISGVYATGKFA